MRRVIVYFLVIAFCSSVAACGDVRGPYYENVGAVVSAIDQHTLSDESESLYQLIGAYDGAKFTVTPDDYRIEIYVYRSNIPDPETLQTADSIVVQEANVLMIFHTTDQKAVGRFVGDLRGRNQ